ncbi:unnamed protein product, partial [Didymodactylos carnosus]
VNILSYNIYMRPIQLFLNDQLIRAKLIPSYVREYDIIIFQEAFDGKARQLIDNNLASSHPYRTKPI